GLEGRQMPAFMTTLKFLKIKIIYCKYQNTVYHAVNSKGSAAIKGKIYASPHCIYAGRTARGYLHNGGIDRAALARRAGCPRGGPPGPMPLESEADRNWVAPASGSEKGLSGRVCRRFERQWFVEWRVLSRRQREQFDRVRLGRVDSALH